MYIVPIKKVENFYFESSELMSTGRQAAKPTDAQADEVPHFRPPFGAKTSQQHFELSKKNVCYFDIYNNELMS